jgi:hypothetical protein
VVGTFDAIEIWKPERFTTVDDEAREAQPGRRWDDEPVGAEA